MATINVSEATGNVLNWMVGQAINKTFTCYPYFNSSYVCMITGDFIEQEWSPSTEWDQAGPLLDQYDISILGDGVGESKCKAILVSQDTGKAYCMTGPTSLIAVMRVLVVYLLGTEVDVPEDIQ